MVQGNKNVETAFGETNNAGTYFGAADQGFQTVQNVIGKGLGLNPAQNAASTVGLPGSKMLGHASGAVSALGLADNIYDMSPNGLNVDNGMNAASNALNVGSWGAATFGAAGGAASTVAAPLMAAGAAGLSLGMASNSFMNDMAGSATTRMARAVRGPTWPATGARHGMKLRAAARLERPPALAECSRDQRTQCRHEFRRRARRKLRSHGDHSAKGWPVTIVRASVMMGGALIEQRLAAFYRLLDQFAAVIVVGKDPQRWTDLAQGLGEIVLAADLDWSGPPASLAEILGLQAGHPIFQPPG